ncbi:hypothetical protein AS034_19690 [[Bacillus] enclensis]|nr:hypothetical protein AS034_19690 [[Bacillus] enclensis]
MRINYLQPLSVLNYPLVQTSFFTKGGNFSETGIQRWKNCFKICQNPTTIKAFPHQTKAITSPCQKYYLSILIENNFQLLLTLIIIINYYDVESKTETISEREMTYDSSNLDFK